MSRWTTIPLAEVAQVFNGKTPSKSEQRDDGHPVLKIKDVTELGGFRGVFDSFVDPNFADAHHEKRLCVGDTLILNAAHNADYVGSKIYFAQHSVAGAIATGEWLVIRPKKVRLDPAFVFHWINSAPARRAIRDMVKGIHLYPKDIARLQVPIPPLTEQRRIAEVLGKADALQATRRAVRSQLDTLTQSIFLDMFGDPTTVLGRWPVSKLGEHLEFLTSGSRGWAKHYSEQGDIFLRIQNVRRDELSLDDVAYVTAPDTAEARRTRVEAGDVLLSITADLGRTAVVPEGLGNSYINQHLAILRTKSFVPRFLSAFLASPAGRAQVLRQNRQAVKAGLNFDDIRGFIIPSPPLATQRKFETAALAVGESQRTQLEALVHLESLAASLQHRAFRGNL